MIISLSCITLIIWITIGYVDIDIISDSRDVSKILLLLFGILDPWVCTQKMKYYNHREDYHIELSVCNTVGKLADNY